MRARRLEQAFCSVIHIKLRTRLESFKKSGMEIILPGFTEAVLF